MKTVTFNTGRKYTARGQVIVATLHDDNVITFMDHSRMISGEIAASEFHTAESVERHTMRAYDNSDYQESRRSRADGMMRGGCNTEEAFEAAAQAEAEAAAAAQAEAEAAAAAACEVKASGFVIQDAQGNAIYGAGDTVQEAWAMVADGVGSFFDAFGNEISEEQAFLTQYKAFGATQKLLAHIKADGGAIAWAVRKGVACTLAEAQAAEEKGLFWFEFDGQLVEPFATLSEAQAVCDEQVEFWLAQDNATRSDELGWGDLSDDAIRNACCVTYSASN